MSKHESSKSKNRMKISKNANKMSSLSMDPAQITESKSSAIMTPKEIKNSKNKQKEQNCQSKNQFELFIPLKNKEYKNNDLT